MIPTNLRFARMQQTLGARAAATSPLMQTSTISKMNPMDRLNFERQRFALRQERQFAPFQLQQQKTAAERGAAEFGEFQAGAGLRGLERQLGTAKTQIGLAGIGDVGQAGQRAYTFGREEEELSRLRMAAEARKLQSQITFQPQMEAIRGGIMSRMAGQFGISLPQMDRPYQSGTGYTPTWMQNYQAPQFPRYS